MKYYSTNNHQLKLSFKEAVQQGLPADNGLFMPEVIPQLPDSFFEQLPDLSLPEIAVEVLRPFVHESIPEAKLREICQDAFSFPVPLRQLREGVYALELYHGPTLAFKDFGARFMARALGYFNAASQKKSTILVATSGDTGSAVASGFYQVENVEVVILYPQGKISDLQEKQMTTLGHNIHTIAIEGTFDDCQKLVKEAFLDAPLANDLGLTSANSINIARLLPQMLYYFYAYGQVGQREKVVFSVPSGNYGNLTAGLIAQRMGLPVHHFIAATNANDIVPQYLQTGEYRPRPSVETISNAMDVGAPSNFVRMQELFNNSVENFRQQISGFSYTDEQTRGTIDQVYTEQGYLLDPHGAVGYRALNEYLQHNNATGVFLETAHPVKFRDVVEPIIDKAIAIPEQLDSVMNKDGQSIDCTADYSSFKHLLKEIVA